MKFFIIPERIVFDLGDKTLAVINRIIDVVEQPQRIAALTARLKASNAKLAAMVAAHPDPDNTD